MSTGNNNQRTLSRENSVGGCVTTAIVGLGISGMSCLRHLSATDALVVIDDRMEPANLEAAKLAFPEARFYVGEDAKEPNRWEGVERVVLSPGVAANDPVLAGSEELPRLSDIDLFMAQARAPVIGITGTNGKSTVTALVGHMLERLGVTVRVGGNLGEAALDLLNESVQAYVLELSSFQIEHSASLPLAAATVLNVSVDHLDRHGDMNNYASIKRRIYSAAQASVSNADDPLTSPDAVLQKAVLPRKKSHNSQFGEQAQARWRLRSVEKLICERDGLKFADADDFALKGQHNLLNILAAFALIEAVEAELVPAGLPTFTASPARYVAAAADFTGLDHRAEFVRELRGVRYVNDSKATNVGASVAALSGYSSAQCSGRRVVLLAGGQGKGADFTPLGPAAARSVKAALLFGEDAQQLEVALASYTSVKIITSFEEALSAASVLAAPGDTVLLAPACASFDMFKSFAARGERFRELVEALS